MARRTASQLVSVLVESPAPRPDAVAREVAARLFPAWQAVLVGAPIAVFAAAILGCVTALAVALPLGLIVNSDPKPAWFGHVSEAAMLPGVVLAGWLVLRWMQRRRAAFASLARDGAIVAAYDVAATGLAAALGTRGGAALAKGALGAVGGVVVQAFGGRIAAAELDGKIIEARTVADARGRFRIPELMLADGAGGYVALMHRSGWIVPQRVLRRRICPPVE